MTRIAVLAPEPIRPRMAGMGIRALELARALSPEFEALLLVPNDPGEAREVAGGLDVTLVRPGALASAARGISAAVVSGHAANSWFHEVPEAPTVADLYDPFPVENLHYARLLGEETVRHDRATLDLAISRADFFLCASAEQRLFYCGALFARGRIGAGNFPDDPELEKLVAVVPFGVPSELPRGDRAAGRRAAGIPTDGPLVLFGGIYDWYDPGLLLEAWPEILRRVPGARLLFFENPNPETTPQRVFARAREEARRVDPGGRSIFFSPWLPYAFRADLYAASDLAVSISSEGLETEVAFRTRLLDAAWGGVPSVSVGGGSLARALERAGGSFSCAREASALAGRVVDLLGDPDRRARAGQAATRYAAAHSWQAVVEPLARWCRRPRVDPGRLPMAGERKPSLLRRIGLFR
jgi:hypothetical protein